MATKRLGPGDVNPQERLKASTSEPYFFLPFQRGDLRSRDGKGRGPKLFDGYGPQLVALLRAELTEAKRDLMQAMLTFPSVPGGLILRLRDDATAKSHRPLDLIDRSNLHHAGHGALDEVLVAGYGNELDLLGYWIENAHTKALQANISALRQIRPWGRSRRNPEGMLALQERTRALVHLFQYSREDLNSTVMDDVQRTVKSLGIQHDWIDRGHGRRPWLQLKSLDELSDEILDVLLSHPGLRRVKPEPLVEHSRGVTQFFPTAELPVSAGNEPIVGVFDSGIHPDARALQSWVVGREVYILPPDTDFVHGTFVASIAAFASHLNPECDGLPVAGCRVFDVAGFGGRHDFISDVTLRLTDVLRRHAATVKVWNLSLGEGRPCEVDEFSEFAHELDRLSDEFGVLFIVAAGNYLHSPVRNWPTSHEGLADRVASPGDSLRAITVGALNPRTVEGQFGAQGQPSPYSRRGPGPVFTQKPDIVHFGGGAHPSGDSNAPLASGAGGLRVLSPSNQAGKTFGTSFAAPVVASLASRIWSHLAQIRDVTAKPALVKALLIHAAQLCSPDYGPHDRRYYGAGVPEEPLKALFDSPDSFTLVFEAQLTRGGQWLKAPYPIPDVLVAEGKLRAEVVITAVSAGPLDECAGAEYSRAQVNLHFGVLDADGHITGKVPEDQTPGEDTFERAQVENGGKWAPVKLHRKRMPLGVQGDQWALAAELLLRAEQTELAHPVSTFIVCTLRSVDGTETNVRDEGIRALNSTNWVRSSLGVDVQLGAT